MPAPIDITGQRFGRLVAAKCVGAQKNHGRVWRCECDCGNEHNVPASTLRSGAVVSCGCYNAERASTLAKRTLTKHGQSTGARTRAYQCWKNLRARCANENRPDYERYGGRGITVCDRWANSFESFYADMGDPPPGRSIDRIDNDKGYSPDNCRWATVSEQNSNQRPRKRRARK